MTSKVALTFCFFIYITGLPVINEQDVKLFDVNITPFGVSVTGDMKTVTLSPGLLCLNTTQ